MFGYIKPFKPEMKIKEFDTYKAIYCGLCKQLGKSYGPFSTLTLSYDFTFLAIIFLGIDNKKPAFQKQTCTANPLKKKACLCLNDNVEFCAATAMIMFYYKLIDNYNDGNLADKAKVMSIKHFAKSARDKSKAKFPQIDQIVKECMDNQFKLENSGNYSIDAAAESSSQALAQILQLASNDEKTQRILYRLGYLVGRFVYLIDALDDLDDDIKSDNFNVFKIKMEKEKLEKEEVEKYARESINLTISQIALSYELLEFKRYKTILDNIIYLGLHDTMKKVIDREVKIND